MLVYPISNIDETVAPFLDKLLIKTYEVGQCINSDVLAYTLDFNLKTAQKHLQSIAQTYPDVWRIVTKPRTQGRGRPTTLLMPMTTDQPVIPNLDDPTFQPLCKRCASCKRFRAPNMFEDSPDCTICRSSDWYGKKTYIQASRNRMIRDWQKRNKDKVRANAKKQSIKNRATYKRNLAIRLWREATADGEYTIEEWLALIAQHGYACVACKERKPLTADHVVPLSQGGANTIDNIQPLCRSCNSAKGNKIIDYRR
jgi:5-methylcytosine-specific restriction endonuclease McrA